MVGNLYMPYGGNRLTSVRDNATQLTYEGATDFNGEPKKEYPLTYNDAGSLVSDAGRKIAKIDYDDLDNPVRIQFTNGNVTKYIYSATGEKLRVTYQTAVPNIAVAIDSTKELSPSEIQCTDYTDYLLGGNLTLKNGHIDKFQFDEGYCQAEKNISDANKDDFTFCYYDQDHLGNIRQVTKADGSQTANIVQTINYYPFGMQFCDGTTCYFDQKHKYNGKEFDNMYGLNTYDYGARQYNPVTARWDRMDPLCEKYYSISPYAYCTGNPINSIDPDGRDVVIVGPLTNMAVQQLQARIGNKVQLSLSSDNYLCYNIVGNGHLNKSTKSLIGMIDNSNITINMTATDKKETSTGALFIGGAFMGNNVELDANDNVINTSAYQEVNPQVLDKADTYSTKGTFIMHELTEAYEGAKISAENKVSSPNSNGQNSVYKKAHDKATNQPPVYRRYYDINGNVIPTENGCMRAEWYVKPNNESTNETIIQTFL